jgi:lipoprotein-anchoring transpeptidase ErfK/SrfK
MFCFPASAREVSFMRLSVRVLLFALPFVLLSDVAQAFVRVHINVGSQRMYVTSSHGAYSWPVSTARRGYRTPHGVFSAKSLQSMHYSKKYDNAPMPHSIFFSGGYAIHGTNAVGALGRPASHGCVRLSPGHASMLYAMVRREGARISIGGR